ncbi:MAG: hypothetical protein JWO03_3733 [Bacteroidetes bacterium]|nr:hypothetical protein [Bacteroidota bacterium]
MSMKPLNQQERNNTFIRYILALIVSMLLFGALFFTGSRLPQKELDVLRTQNAEYKSAIDKQAKMLSLMDSIEANLAVLDKAGADASYGETEVSNLLVQMKSNIADTSGINLIYKKIASNYQRAMQDKHMIRDMRKDSEAGTECAKDLEKANKQIMDYQMMLVSMGANVPK